MLRMCGLFLFVATTLLAVMVERGTAATLFFDDFESADPVGTILPDLPPVGEAWKKYVSTSTDSYITTNPESEVRNSSANVYRTTRTVPNNPSGVPTVIAPISAAGAAHIAATKNATVEFKYRDSGTPNSLSLIVNDATPGIVPTGFAAAGINFVNGRIFQSGVGTLANYTLADWHDIKIDFNFDTQNYAFSIDDVVAAPSVPFLNAGRTTLTNLWFGHYAGDSLFFIDDVQVSNVPEPASAFAVAFGSVLFGLTHRRRFSQI